MICLDWLSPPADDLAAGARVWPAEATRAGGALAAGAARGAGRAAGARLAGARCMIPDFLPFSAPPRGSPPRTATGS